MNERGTTGTERSWVQIPPGPNDRRLSLDRALGIVSRHLVVTTELYIAANAGGTTASKRVSPWGSTPLLACALTSGAPVVSSLLSPRLNAWRMQAGLQGRAPGLPGGRTFKPSRASKWLRSSSVNRPVACCRQSKQDECLQDYIGKRRFKSARQAARLAEILQSFCRPAFRVTDAVGTTGRRSLERGGRKAWRLKPSHRSKRCGGKLSRNTCRLTERMNEIDE